MEPRSLCLALTFNRRHFIDAGYCPILHRSLPPLCVTCRYARQGSLSCSLRLPRSVMGRVAVTWAVVPRLAACAHRSGALTSPGPSRRAEGGSSAAEDPASLPRPLNKVEKMRSSWSGSIHIEHPLGRISITADTSSTNVLPEFPSTKHLPMPPARVVPLACYPHRRA